MAEYRDPKVTKPSTSKSTMIGFVVVATGVVLLAWAFWPG